MKTSLFRVGVLLTASIGLVAGESSWCQPYPSKPVRLIVQGLPGTAPDLIARLIAPRLSESLGQPVIIDNRGGAGGIVAAQIAATSPADGYMVLLAASAGVSIAPFLAKKRPYDPIQDFTPVTLVAITPLIVTMHPSLPVKSVKELIGLAKARPKQLLYATPGAGSVFHLTIEMFSRAAGITMVHVPYKGGPPAVIDTISGQVQLVISTVIPVLPHVRASRLRALAVTGSKRMSVVPEVATVAESGLYGFESLQWWAMFAPRNTPNAITERLFNEVRKAVASPSVTSVLAREGLELSVNGRQPLAEFHRIEIAKWQKVIHDLREFNVVLE